MAIIKLINIGKKYGSGNATVRALKNINLDVEKGEMIAIMGKSGCGKSTLINILGGLTEPVEGEYYYNGELVHCDSPNWMSKFRQQHISYIVQNYALINNKTAKENIELPILNKPKKEREKQIKNIAQMLEIGDKLHRYPFEMSGGECQRVAIARALINNPDIILADEPTGSLDTQNENIIISILKEISHKGTTVIIVTHDANVANKCDRTIYLKDGEIISN